MELEREWTFTLHFCRVLALSHETGPDRATGIDIYYERLSDWGDVWRAALLNAALHENGVPDEWLMGLSVEMKVFDSIYRTRSGQLSVVPDDPFRGRHAVALIGITSDDEHIFQNSWGPDWGDGGIGYLTRSYFEKHVQAVWLTRPSYLGWSPRMDDELSKLASNEEAPGDPSEAAVAIAWMTPNRPTTKNVSVNGLRCRIRMRQVLSSVKGRPLVEMVDISSDEEILGRVHLELPAASNAAIVHELFVHPSHRRRAIGTALVRLAEDRARSAGRRSLSVILHEADNSPDGADRARAFLASVGYALTPDSSVAAPFVLGTGVLA
jgi:GNAT superfamily N-acetyltransferase